MRGLKQGSVRCGGEGVGSGDDDLQASIFSQKYSRQLQQTCYGRYDFRAIFVGEKLMVSN